MPKRRFKRHPVTQPSDQSYRLIPLTQGQNAIVDTEDYEWLDQWNWCAFWNRCTKSFYPQRRVSRTKCVFMHNNIMKPRKGQQVDHKNHNTLDNRRSNLRCCTSYQNKLNVRHRNTSGYIGVSFWKERGKWRARIGLNGKHKTLGYFATAEEAARCYDKAALERGGEFAILNFS